MTQKLCMLQHFTVISMTGETISLIKTANFVYVTNRTQKSHVFYYPHLTEFLSLPSSSLW